MRSDFSSFGVGVMLSMTRSFSLIGFPLGEEMIFEGFLRRVRTCAGVDAGSQKLFMLSFFFQHLNHWLDLFRALRRILFLLFPVVSLVPFVPPVLLFAVFCILLIASCATFFDLASIDKYIVCNIYDLACLPLGLRQVANKWYTRQMVSCCLCLVSAFEFHIP